MAPLRTGAERRCQHPVIAWRPYAPAWSAGVSTLSLHGAPMARHTVARRMCPPTPAAVCCYAAVE